MSVDKIQYYAKNLDLQNAHRLYDHVLVILGKNYYQKALEFLGMAIKIDVDNARPYRNKAKSLYSLWCDKKHSCVIMRHENCVRITPAHITTKNTCLQSLNSMPML